MPFSGSLEIEFGDFGPNVGRYARTLSDFTWQSDTVVIVVPKGTISDGATVPRPLWWFLPPWGDLGTQAAVLHDYLCEQLDKGTPVNGCETRSLCDHQFYLALVALGVPAWRAWLAWLGVRSYSLTHGYKT